MKITLVKKVSFAAGHRLYNPEFSDDKNKEIFGACSNPSGHGHNYSLEVFVTGQVNSQTGMLINLKELKMVIDEEIISKLDHKNLNTDVDFMKGIIPTTENLALSIFRVLDRRLGNGLLARVVVWETENNRVIIERNAGGRK